MTEALRPKELKKIIIMLEDHVIEMFGKFCKIMYPVFWCEQKLLQCICLYIITSI